MPTLNSEHELCYSTPMWNNGVSFIRPLEVWRSVDLAAGHTVVHLGCGAGYYLLPAAEIVGPQGRVIGIDIRSDMLAEAENRARRAALDQVIQTIRIDLEKEAGHLLAADQADFVLVANILHQADNQKILAEAARLAKPEGKVVVIDWDVAASPLGPPAEQRISQKVVIERAEASGLKHEHSFRPSPYHYGLIFSAAA